MGKVEEYIKKKIKKEKLHFSLIDPDPKKMTKEKIIDILNVLKKTKTDAILVGGSSGVKNSFLDEAVKIIKEDCSVPIILFPGNASTGISKYADAILFLCLMNAKDVAFTTGMQSVGAIIVKECNLEPIPTGYIIIEPGMKAGENANLIKRNEIDKAVSYALASQYMGMRLVYLEAGSGAYEHVPREMISKVKNNIEIPLIVGGGIKTQEQAIECLEAGADIIVTGNIIEKDLKKAIEIIDAVKSF